MKRSKEPSFKSKGIDFGDFEQCEFGYWIGQTTILGLLFHVEVVELVKARTSLDALNRSYQGRIDTWRDNNDWVTPNVLVDDEGRRFFVHAEVYSI